MRLGRGRTDDYRLVVSATCLTKQSWAEEGEIEKLRAKRFLVCITTERALRRSRKHASVKSDEGNFRQIDDRCRREKTKSNAI